MQHGTITASSKARDSSTTPPFFFSSCSFSSGTIPMHIYLSVAIAVAIGIIVSCILYLKKPCILLISNFFCVLFTVALVLVLSSLPGKVGGKGQIKPLTRHDTAQYSTVRQIRIISFLLAFYEKNVNFDCFETSRLLSYVYI